MIRPADLQDDDVWSMFEACKDGDLERVKSLVSRRPSLIRCEYNYTPPIHFAVREGHLIMVRYLLEMGADIAYRSYPFQESLLTMAQNRGHHEIAKLLLEKLSLRYTVSANMTAILDAARNGDLLQIQAELERNPGLAWASNETGDTALHQAAEGGHGPIMLLLLDAGAPIDAVRADGNRPITCALNPRGKSPHLVGSLVQMLLERGALYNIYLAAELGDDAYIREVLIHNPALANFEDTSHRRPISAAARRNDLPMARLLLEQGADPSLPEEGAPLGQALWFAVYQNEYEMAKLLLEYGANPNTAPESSGSALHHAQQLPKLKDLLLKYGAEENNGDLELFERLVADNEILDVELLLKEQPDLAKQANAFWGEGILSVPANNGHREMLQLLIRYGARVPDVSKWGRAYYFKHYEFGALLLYCGMNPDHMNWQRITLLHEMSQEGDLEKARLLLDYGADINAIDEDYRSTPLGFAARWGQREIVALLLARGADPNKAGATWATPLSWSQKKGYTEIEADLRSAGAK
ncbi:ankyrin repeat domain-containing protein [Paenibacillus sp. CF384]|uniref:ankyrin repeat domain-containing protein n=1 Tax=Paenibacillus sp. CF384 TaxID=1884382 RepID=UPI000895235B|nr:ankyrin repeat domain-containing protein [Paenibacillus sp. CF384]SDW11378.1 Ankyrin repeat-containing protein [Paenibacillus sp. CF384]